MGVPYIEVIIVICFIVYVSVKYVCEIRELKVIIHSKIMAGANVTDSGRL